jgi:hypothetical protein
MNIVDFKRIITSFADKPTDLEFDRGLLLTEIRGELIQAKVFNKDSVLFIKENDVEDSASNWIRNRIACLPQLADRIIDYIPTDKSFVNPCGRLLDELEYDPEEREQEISNTTGKLIEILSRKVPGTSSIVYLTSDAGEGKTTLINELAHQQANNFKQKKSDWLLLPIPLGGRPFLRFDDIVIASTVNNLRFRYLYYDSFIELVRLGFIVPAFDGFEEMFMQTSTGEALTATGGLINKLNSSGAILIAARKAYFEYKSFGSQAKLLDSINSSVSFARLAIERWNEAQFIEYTEHKGVKNAKAIYNLVSEKLHNPSHPILTRPVLVKQLIDVFMNIGDVHELIKKLESVTNYFPAFVNAIIDREANHKWIDSSGEMYKPILTVEQHYELLSVLAEEMWVNSSDSLKDSVLDVISEMFSEQKKFDIQTSRQIKERIKQHALIVRTDPNNPNYRFDHEEFYEFFLGIAIANNILNNKIQDTRSLLKKSPLPFQTCDSIVARIKSETKNYKQIISILDSIVKGENQFSYIKENAGNIVIRILSNEKIPDVLIKNYELPINSFLTITLDNITFEECHFQNTSLASSKISNCNFIKCQFDRIEINNLTTFSAVKLVDCDISTVYDNSKDKGFYEQHSIGQYLKSKGITIEKTTKEPEVKPVAIIDDEDLELTEKALRKFIRQNLSINDNMFKLRLGNKANHFLDEILPVLLKHEILVEVDYDGSGQKRRFKLGVTFGQIEEALNNSKGSYKKFINQFERQI